jgi:hypothetical protein
MTEYRVWPDGTIQEASEDPYPWMSDDYTTVWALDEDDAYAKALGHGG